MEAETDRQPKLDALLIEIAEAAANPWAVRSEVRRCHAEAIAGGNYLVVGSPERLALRVDRSGQGAADRRRPADKRPDPRG